MSPPSRPQSAQPHHATPDIPRENPDRDHEDEQLHFLRRLGQKITKFVSMMVGGGG